MDGKNFQATKFADMGVHPLDITALMTIIDFDLDGLHNPAEVKKLITVTKYFEARDQSPRRIIAQLLRDNPTENKLDLIWSYAQTQLDIEAERMHQKILLHGTKRDNNGETPDEKTNS